MNCPPQGKTFSV